MAVWVSSIRLPHVPEESVRERVLNGASVRAEGRFVLYWMTSARRAGWNHALDGPLTTPGPGATSRGSGGAPAHYPWASDRFHRFVMDGMVDGKVLRPLGSHIPYVESRVGEGKGLLESLAKDACVVVTDDFPCFFLSRADRARCRYAGRAGCSGSVDSNGLYPMRATTRVFARAHDFRRHLKDTPPTSMRSPERTPSRGLSYPN